jgi:hypothetical protein
MCRPFGTRLISLPYPALPCRATGCSVPAGLFSLLHPSRAVHRKSDAIGMLQAHGSEGAEDHEVDIALQDLLHMAFK